VSRRLWLCTALTTLAAVSAQAQVDGLPQRFIDDAFVSTRITIKAPVAAALKIPVGTILMPDRDGYQPMVVSEIRLEQPDGYANEISFDPKTRIYTVVLQGEKPKTLIALGYCLIDIAKAPEEGVTYRLSSKRVPFETLSRIANSKEETDFQELLWQEVQKQLVK
jgi:hypothetical protein